MFEDYDQIFFGGQALPCMVEKFPVIRKAQRKHTVYNVPGRNGNIYVQQDAFENVITPYQIFCGNGDVQADWSDLAEILYQEGYQTLSDIDDPAHFRLAVFNGPVDAEYYWNQVGRTTLEFDCRPERFLLSGQTATEYPKVVDLYGNPVPFTINNPTAYTAKPLILVTITPGGSGVITANGETLTITAVPVSGFYLDCENQDAYIGTTNLNGYISGTFPVLKPGANTYVGDGDVSKLTITPRFWEL